MPKLQILPVEDLIRHEKHDAQRSIPLIERLRASGVLRNPPIVAPLGDGSDRYAVLDGSNRTTAMGLMGIPHCICQLVDADDDGLGLSTWNHVLWNWDPKVFLLALQGMSGIALREIDPETKIPKIDWPENTLVWVQFPNAKTYIAQSKSEDLSDKAIKLSKIAELYSNKAELDRTRAAQIKDLPATFSNICALVVYPPFKIQEILRLTSKSVLLPPGVTRFFISPRALRVNYPLEQLSSSNSLQGKNDDLERWKNERRARKGIRFYSETTVLFDE